MTSEETMIEVLKNESAKPINERRSISSHTMTEHGVYDDEPFPTEGNAYWWYQRAVYWKREAHRSEGQQQTMNFEEKHSSGMSANNLMTVRNFIKAGQFINAIKHVRMVTSTSLFEAKELCEKLRTELGWNGLNGASSHFSNP